MHYAKVIHLLFTYRALSVLIDDMESLLSSENVQLDPIEYEEDYESDRFFFIL